jgi:hypothetical protein
MQPGSKLTICLLLSALSFFCCQAQKAIPAKDKNTTIEILPEGNNGIAARHPGDKGISNDPKVIFADDFESYQQSSDIDKRWDFISHASDTHITTDPKLAFHGKQALEFVIPQQTGEQSDGVDKFISPERDIVFLRYYAKFHAPFDVIGSSHNGAGISAHYFSNRRATPGIPANGTNKFLVNLENWRGDTLTPSPGHLNLYVYHPEQRDNYGDHFFPDGIVLPYSMTPFDFGKDFISRPMIITPLDQWFCYELMVKANTPGKRDGRIAIWIDGKLVGDFQNLRFRDIESLKMDRAGVCFHIKTNPKGEAKKWFDNVVIADSYIGPMVKE